MKAQISDQKADLQKQLGWANERWNYAHGMWLQTRLSTWDEEVKLASTQIGYINSKLDDLAAQEAAAEVTALAAE